MIVPGEPYITKKVDREGEAYYTVRWSPLIEVDKYKIIRAVPAVAGIFELYYQDDYKKLIRFYMARVWIGGLRSSLRRITDLTLNDEKKWQDVLENKKCFFRYSICHSYMDLTDVLYFFAETFFPDEEKTENSNRYAGISVDEISPEKIIDI